MQSEIEHKTPEKIEPKLVSEWKLPTGILGISASAEGNHLFVACMDGTIRNVDAFTGKERVIGRHVSYASRVVHHPGRSLVISAGYDGSLRWHDWLEGRSVRRLKAHDFWVWDLAQSQDGSKIAVSSGQYLAGGYQYEPADSNLPTVKVFDTSRGDLLAAFQFKPPVLSVAFSPDGDHIAAGNMMGDIKIWRITDQQEVASWNTPDFTSWGIIKSHHYIGGIFGMTFTPDGSELIVCGMGPMRDPMAGNGKQTWQRFTLQGGEVRKRDQIHEGEQGNGLMETIVYHPDGTMFLMAGRLAQGNWNVAVFDHETGALIHGWDCKMRATSAAFSKDGSRLYLGGAKGQGKPEGGVWPEFGRVLTYEWV